MNSQKYLTKNELNYINRLLEDAKISKRIDDVIKKEIVNKKVELKPEMKEYLIKNIDDIKKEENLKVDIDDTFKKNMLSIMTVNDYNSIKDNEYFDTFNKNIININFERIKNYIKKNYINLKIDEFIPIVKQIISKKELSKTDNLKERIDNSYDNLDKIISNYEIYLKTQKEQIIELYNDDNSLLKTNDEKTDLNNLVNEIIREIDKDEKKISTLFTMAESYYKNIYSEAEPGRLLNELENIYNKMIKYNGRKRNYVVEYEKSRDVLLNNSKISSAKKIQHLFRSLKTKKEYTDKKLQQLNNEKKLSNNEIKEINIYIDDLINNVIEELQNNENNENNNKMIITDINNVNKKLDDLMSEIDDRSTQPYTDIGDNQTELSEAPSQIIDIDKSAKNKRQIDNLIELKKKEIKDMNYEIEYEDFIIDKIDKLTKNIDFSNDDNMSKSISEMYRKIYKKDPIYGFYLTFREILSDYAKELNKEVKKIKKEKKKDENNQNEIIQKNEDIIKEDNVISKIFDIKELYIISIQKSKNIKDEDKKIMYSSIEKLDNKLNFKSGEELKLSIKELFKNNNLKDATHYDKQYKKLLNFMLGIELF
jgi:hypothetical protein